MNHELPRPETSHTPEVRLFNVDAMSDEQIIVTYRGYWTVANHLGNEDTDDFDQMDIGDGLNEQVAAEVRDLASRDPERVKQLVTRTTASQEDSDQDLAANAAPALLNYDYAFTRDTLISITMGEAYERCVSRGISSSDSGSGYASETALGLMRELMRDRLTPEQIADFQAHAAAFDPGWPLEPARPEE